MGAEENRTKVPIVRDKKSSKRKQKKENSSNLKKGRRTFVVR